MGKVINIYAGISLTVFIVFFISSGGHSQESPLLRLVSISAYKEPVGKVLAEISKDAGVNFSYNSDIVPLDSLVSYNVRNATVSKALYILLGRDYYYKTLGNHIIILKRKNVKNVKAEKPKKALCTVSGFIYNSLTHEKLSAVSVFDLNKNISALSDSGGFYKLSFVPGAAMAGVGFSKNGFNDTVVFVRPGIVAVDINLAPEKSFLPVADTFEKARFKQIIKVPVSTEINEYKIVRTFVKPDMLAHAKSLDIQETRTFQFSLLPTIGTNRRISGAMVNRVSFNAIAGYSGGVNGVEIGTLNISKKDVKGFQMSCLGNVTGGNTKGVQIGGAFNCNVGNASGVQLAVGGNFILDTLKGAQIGFFNYARTNRGFQFGIVNTADSSDAVSVGFVSFVKKGYYCLSLFEDEMLMTNLTFKMGTHKFYNIWGVSAIKDMWGLTYGFGMYMHPPVRRINFNYDLTLTNMSYKKTFEIQLCMKTKLSGNINLRLNNKLYIYAGLSYNIFASDKVIDIPLQEYVDKITMSKIFSTTLLSVRLQHWPGYEAGIKFRL